MRVHFDSQIFCAQSYGGISRYVASLATALDALGGVTPQILAPHHCNSYLTALEPHLVRGRRAGESPSPLHRLLGIAGSAWMHWRQPSEILHKTYYYPVPRVEKRAKVVLTVHDMIHEKFADSYREGDPIARWKRQAVQCADVILCVSENTRRDLLAHYPELSGHRVFVTHLGFDGWSSAERVPMADDRFRAPEWPYLLFVGGRHGYKNFAGLLDAYGASAWLQEHFGVVCFGGGAFSSAERALIDRLRHPTRILQMGGSDSLLAQCYRHAALFVYPSLYEGFGLPPLEAMAADCPVACSNTSSIPEVVGDAGAYFDPADADAVRSVLERVLNADQERVNLVTHGRLRRTVFSWRQCALKTRDAYATALAAI